MRSIALAAGVFSVAILFVTLGAYTGIAAISMPGILLAVLAVVPLLAGVIQLIWPNESAPDSTDGLEQS